MGLFVKALFIFSIIQQRQGNKSLYVGHITLKKLSVILLVYYYITFHK